MKLERRFPLASILAGLVLSLAAPDARSANCTWNTTNGNWNEIAKWMACVAGNGNPTGSPGSVDTATVGSSGVVTINTGQSVLNLNNAGRINIDAFLLTLVGGGSTINTGTINVGAGAIPNNAALQVGAGHNITNTGGVINISADSVLNQFGSTITGGTISTAGTGAVVAFTSSSNFLNGVTLTGTLDMASIANSRERIVNGATINGAINIGNGGILSLDSTGTAGGNQTITGTATVNLNDAGARLAIEGNGSTTLGANVVVRGQGNIGQPQFAGGNNTLTNNGLISADVSGGTLNIVAPANSGSFVNNGTLQAINGATLLLSTNITSNSGSQISAGAGSAVVQNGVRLNGVINVNGTGSFQATSSSANFLDGVNLTGTLDMASIANSRERIVNGATINGAINIGNGGILSLDSTGTAGGNQTITGTATVNLNDAGARLAIEGNGSTTLGANVVVRGQGNIGQPQFAGGNNTLTNNGLISADVSGGTLNIVAPANSGSFVNNGTLQAINGATLLLSTNITSNSGSQISAGAGSAVVQNGVRLNGVINVNGTGSFQATSSSANFLDGVNLTGTLDMASIANSRERIVNGATINGAINIGNGGILSLDSTGTAGGNQTITGTATVNLNDAGARLAIEGNGSTTLGANVVVRGQGNIGQPQFAGGNNTLTNNGLISADVSGGTLNIVAPANSGSFVNNGTLQAINGATLLLSTNITSNSGSQISAGAGSAVVQNGVRLNGVINVNGTGSFQATSSSANFLDGVNLTGTLDMASIANSRERIVNGATINGAINIGNGGILSLDSTGTAGGNQTITGTATINLNDAGARLAIEGNGSTTLGANVVVRGQGNIGQPQFAGGNNTLTNNGLISADVSGGTLNIVAPANSGSFVNNGTLQANPGATMTVTAGITNFSVNTLTGGTYIVNGATGSTGTMQLSSLGNFAAGEIVNNAANITLNGPTANTRLVDAGGNAALKSLASNSGSVTFSGGYAFTSVGNLANSDTVNIGSGSSLTVGPGAANNYNQSAGTTSVLGNLSAANVNINGGTLLGTGTVSGNTMIASGAELLPGTSATAPGTLSFTGSLSLNGALDEVLNQSGFGMTSVIGSLTLSGSSILNLLQDPHYNPVAGTTFTIMTAGSPVSGAFSSILNQTFNAGTEMWSVVYNQSGNNVELIATNVGGTAVTATWSTPSGNWTTATQWSCAPGPSICAPNNDANFAYSVVLNSPGATLTLDSTSSPTSVGVLSLLAQAGTLNVGAGSTLSASGSVTNMGPSTLQLSGGTLVVAGSLGNNGSITGNGTITGAGVLTNTGAVYANAGTLDLSGLAITNLSGGTLTGGTWQAGVTSAGTLKLPGDITTNSAGIFLQNAGSQIIDGTGANALAGLTSNQGGALTLFNGATFTTGGGFTNNNGSAVSSSFGGSALTVNGNLANTNASLANVDGNFGGASIAVLGNFSNDGTSTVHVQNGGALTVSGGFTSDGAVTHTSSAVTIGNNLVIGNGGGANATYAISGAGSTLNVGTGGLSVPAPFANSVVVGNSGNGAFTQSAGTTVTIGSGTNAASVAGTQVLSLGVNPGGSGTYTIGGSGSTLEVWGNSAGNNSAITVGSGGTGLFVQTGGAVIAHGANSLAIGDCCGGNGQYQISAGTLTAAGNAFVGAHSQGAMLQAGGAVSVGGALYLGYATNAVGQYTMNASAGNGAPSLQVAGSMFVGVNADATGAAGTFNQSAGTTTIGGNLSLGVNAGSSGTMHVSGGSSVSMTGPGATAVVGESGTGLLTLDGASTMTLPGNGSVIVGLTSSASGTLIVTGASSLNAGSLLGIGHNGTTSTGASATVIVDDLGSSITATNIYVGSGGCLGGNGVIHGTVIMDGATASLNQCPQLHGPLPLAGNGLVNPNGILNPGRSPGRLVIDGGFNFISGTIVLEVESDGLGGFLFDELVFGPTCTLCVLDLLDMNIVFSFLGNTDPTAFQNSGLWNLNTFFKTTTDPSGFGPDTGISTGLGETLAAIFGQSCTAQTPPVTPCATFTAESSAYDIQQFTFTTEGESGVETLVAPPGGGSTVPEPGTMMLVLLGGVLLLLAARRQEPARRARSG